MNEGNQALRSEVRALHGPAWGWALTCCKRDAEQAQEVLQDSYAKVLEGRAVFGQRSSFKTWLFAVIRMTAREHSRRRTLQSIGLARFQSASPTRVTPSDALVVQERVHALTLALATLATRQREVLHLVFYQEMTVQDAAVAMNISVGSARRHYHRGKKNLLDRLERQGVSP